jgi:hypothetical protein
MAGNSPQGHEHEGVGSRVHDSCAGFASLLALVKIRAQASDLGNADGAPERLSKELDPGVYTAATAFTL